MKSSVLKTLFSSFMILTLVIALSVFIGCSDDDDDGENNINVCNQDDEEYVVKLHQESNNMVRDFRLGEWYDFADLCDKFKNVPVGWYTISIHEDGASTASDTSERFYMDSNTDRHFWIKSPGELKTSDDGIIRVCNSDDEEYEVKLHRDSDETVARQFTLEEWYDRNKCDNFEGIASERYYITIHEDGAATASDISEVFVYDGAADHYFLIESPGRINKQ